jgi:hypothetical protein
MSAQPVYKLTLTPTGPDPPLALRLRRALKLLLPACGLRCSGVEQLAGSPDDAPAGPPTAADGWSGADACPGAPDAATGR